MPGARAEHLRYGTTDTQLVPMAARAVGTPTEDAQAALTIAAIARAAGTSVAAVGTPAVTANSASTSRPSSASAQAHRHRQQRQRVSGASLSQSSYNHGKAPPRPETGYAKMKRERASLEQRVLELSTENERLRSSPSAAHAAAADACPASPARPSKRSGRDAPGGHRADGASPFKFEQLQ